MHTRARDCQNAGLRRDVPVAHITCVHNPTVTAFARGGSLAWFLAKMFAIVVIRPPERRLAALSSLKPGDAPVF